MRDEDAGDFDRSEAAGSDDRRSIHPTVELFGDFSVLSPGVHIVLDGRAISRNAE